MKRSPQHVTGGYLGSSYPEGNADRTSLGGWQSDLKFGKIVGGVVMIATLWRWCHDRGSREIDMSWKELSFLPYLELNVASSGLLRLSFTVAPNFIQVSISQRNFRLKLPWHYVSPPLLSDLHRYPFPSSNRDKFSTTFANFVFSINKT